jgi:hypothetical protein
MHTWGYFRFFSSGKSHQTSSSLTERAIAKAAVLRRNSISHDVMMLAPNALDGTTCTKPKVTLRIRACISTQAQACSSRESSIPQTPSLLLLVNRFGRQTTNFRAGKAC